MSTGSWLHHRRFELAENYVRRGRIYAGLSLAQVRLRWLEALVAWSKQYDSLRRQCRVSDLQLELYLRGEEPPWRHADSSIRAIQACARRKVTELSAVARTELLADAVSDLERLQLEEKSTTRH